MCSLVSNIKATALGTSTSVFTVTLQSLATFYRVEDTFLPRVAASRRLKFEHGTVIEVSLPN